MQRRLYRSVRDRMLGGVCGGLANYVNVDPTLIRFLWVAFTFFTRTPGILLYIIAWIIVPEEPM
ncbi:MAG: PspC domain-containing protein [Firmicutes bacterium]|jgi:phage shock protein C|nr:PspC domain-containing protein [Bacillota bacterium]MDD4337024.1 PspC domain-containing protein [Bacillota bacterium]MDD4791945.1 PspC domain-containing protein [Bacillota bacterium]